MPKEINYFGYGTNRDPEMMEAIIGRKPDGLSGYMLDYELCIQTWGQIPERVRGIMSENWGPDGSEFRTYCARPAKGKKVKGEIWRITEDERKLVANWEFEGLWYQSAIVTVENALGNIANVETQVINDPILTAVDGKNYGAYLNDWVKQQTAAYNVRKKFLSGKPDIELK